MSSALKQIDGVLGRPDMVKVDPLQIDVEAGWNPRQDTNPGFTDEKIASLKAFIVANGVTAIPPIRVARRGNRFVLRQGHRRLRAVRELLDEGVPIHGMHATIEPPLSRTYTEADALLVAIGSHEGEPLTPFDEGAAFARLIAFGWEAHTIAEKLGKSRSFVSERLKLNEAEPDTVAAYQAGDASVRDVVDAVRHSQNGTGSQHEHLRQTQVAKASTSQAKKVARGTREPKTMREVVWGYLDVYGVEALETIIADFKMGRNGG